MDNEEDILFSCKKCKTNFKLTKDAHEKSDFGDVVIEVIK